MKKTKLLIGFLISLFVIRIFTYIKSLNKWKEIEYDGIPTVFVHGYKGTILTFAKMLLRLKKSYPLGKSVITYIVDTDGSIQKKSLGRLKGRPIFIQVVFKNNRTTFAETTKYLANVLMHLKKTYRINKVNIVGHSMGGIVSVKYAQEYHGKVYPRINKLVTLGSPFAGIFDQDYFIFNKDQGAEDLKVDSLAVRRLHTLPFPDDTNVLNIGSTGDNRAVPASVSALRNIVPRDQLKEIIVRDEKLSHSGLHEDERVDELIYRFLWKDSLQ